MWCSSFVYLEVLGFISIWQEHQSKHVSYYRHVFGGTSSAGNVVRADKVIPGEFSIEFRI